MGEYETRFTNKWDFRRKENNFDDSSSDDDPDSNLIIHNPNLVLDSNQIGDGTKTVTSEQPLKTKRRSKKDDEGKPEKPKQVRRRKSKTVSEEENKKKGEMDDVGLFMKTLLDDLTASRESLMDWVKTELYGSDQTVATKPPLKRRAVKKSGRNKKKKKKVEEEKQSKEEENGADMNKPKEKSPEIAHNGGDQELDCNAGPLDRFLKSGLGRNYFHQQQQQQQQQQGQVGIVAQTETVKNQKSVVLAIKAPNLSESQKKTREANTIKNSESKTHKDNSFVIPFASKLSSSQSLHSTQVGNSWFSSSSSSSSSSSQLGMPSLASNNNNFQVRQPPPLVPQIHDISEFQTGFTQGHAVFGSSLFQKSSGFFPGFPSNLISSGYSFPTQQRGNNNMHGGMRMAGGAIRFAGESDVGNNSLSDYRNNSFGT